MRGSFFGSVDVPKVIKFSEDLELLIDWYKECDYEEVAQLMKAATKEGKGVGVKEFTTEGSIKEKIDDPNEKIFTCRDNSNRQLISAFFISPCSLSRSQNSPNRGAYGFVNELYRGQGIGQNLIYLMMKYMASSLGYRSVIGRHALTSRTNIPGRAAGATYMGIIPKSLKIDKPNVVVDDVIVYYGYHWPKLSPEKVFLSYLCRLYCPERCKNQIV